MKLLLEDDALKLTRSSSQRLKQFSPKSNFYAYMIEKRCFVFKLAKFGMLSPETHLQKYLSAIDRAFSTSFMESKNAIYFIQIKLLLGELLISFSKSSTVLPFPFYNSFSSAALKIKMPNLLTNPNVPYITNEVDLLPAYASAMC